MSYITTQMIAEYCCKCSMPFSISEDFYDRKVKDHTTFYCPYGHPQNYVGKTEEQKLKERLRRSELEREQAEGYVKELEKSRSAFKGQITKTKNRISKGLCPCCNRSFLNMKRHMEHQHPDYIGKGI